MYQARYVVRLLGLRDKGADDLAGKQGDGNAVLPERAPGEGRATDQRLEVVDDGRGHGEMANLFSADKENSFLDSTDRLGQTEVDRVDHPKYASGKTGIPLNNLADFLRISLSRVEKLHDFPCVLIEGRQRGALLEP